MVSENLLCTAPVGIKLETTKVFIGGRRDKFLVYLHNGILYSNENKCYHMFTEKEKHQEYMVEKKEKEKE